MRKIQMEDEYPSKSDNNRLAILDLEVWKDDHNFIVYRHYEKKVASRKVLHANSAQSAACKKSVHVQEVLRRLLNCSEKLDWDIEVVPVITDYMVRLKIAGYNQGYRKYILGHAIRIYNQMLRDDKTGSRPIFRPRNWQTEERRIDKKKKKHSWAEKGGYIAPIFVPPTPGGELLKMLCEVAEKEAFGRLKFKLVEGGGRSVKGEVQKSNPTGKPGCSSPDCLPCQPGRGAGGNCRRNNIQYEMECKLCPVSELTVYVGETARNLYTRAGEHLAVYRGKLNGAKKESFIYTHQQEKHRGAPPNFTAKVTKSFGDCLTRQISEAVWIRRSTREVLNSKSEWHQPALFQVQHEINRG